MSNEIVDLSIYDAIDILDDKNYDTESRKMMSKKILDALREGMTPEFYENEGGEFIGILRGLFSVLVSTGDAAAQADEGTEKEQLAELDKAAKSVKERVKMIIQAMCFRNDIV